jgi:SPP1 gp7 family putative phage head morphogenesis protein
MNPSAFAATLAPILTTDREVRRETKHEASAWAKARRAEAFYARQLRKVARHVGEIIKAFTPGDPTVLPRLMAILERYAGVIAPWAEATAGRMLVEVSRRDEAAWAKASKDMRRALRQEIRDAPTGQILRDLLAEQVGLITSLPLDAAQRVHKLTLEGISDATRFEQIVPMILASGDVTVSRANLIARTETARTASVLTQARAEHVGSDGYVWRTARDRDVRPLHKRLEGTYHAWVDPPVAGEAGERAHPGQIYNCFTGDTLVRPLGGYLRAFRAIYRGPLIILRVADTLIRVTPNHPILTPKGRVAAGSLKEGDHVFQSPSQNFDGVKHYVDDGLLSFEEIFKTSSSDVKVLPIHDFYGDVVEGQVQVIGTEQHLLVDSKSSGFQRVRDQVIPRPDCWVGGAGVEGGISKVFKPSSSGSSYVRNMIAARASTYDQLVGFGLRSEYDTSHDQRAFDGWSGDTILARQAQFGGTSNVSCDDFLLGQFGTIGRGQSSCLGLNASLTEATADKIRIDTDDGCDLREQFPFLVKPLCVIDKSVRDFSGHVYTMETTSGYYSVGRAALVAKNCRCYPEPVIPDVIQ